jgi:hypothetical protein
MRTSTKLKIAGGAIALGSLALIIPAQAGAAGSNNAACIVGCKDSAATVSYSVHGYAYGVSDSPGSGADLIHVKLRGHTHTLEFKSFTSQGKVVVDDHAERIANSENGWFDPRVVSTVQITLSDKSAVSVSLDKNHCYYENKHGNLAPATVGGACTPN